MFSNAACTAHISWLSSSLYLELERNFTAAQILELMELCSYPGKCKSPKKKKEKWSWRSGIPEEHRDGSVGAAHTGHRLDLMVSKVFFQPRKCWNSVLEHREHLTWRRESSNSTLSWGELMDFSGKTKNPSSRKEKCSSTSGNCGCRIYIQKSGTFEIQTHLGFVWLFFFSAQLHFCSVKIWAIQTHVGFVWLFFSAQLHFCCVKIRDKCSCVSLMTLCPSSSSSSQVCSSSFTGYFLFRFMLSMVPVELNGLKCIFQPQS